MSGYVPKIVPLTPEAHTPEVILHRTLAKVDKIKTVVIVIEWDDERMAVDRSISSIKTLTMASAVLHNHVQYVLDDNFEED